MTQKLINGIIVAVQASASAKYGADTQETIAIVRTCQSELNEARISQFDAIKTKWMQA